MISIYSIDLIGTTLIDATVSVCSYVSAKTAQPIYGEWIKW